MSRILSGEASPGWSQEVTELGDDGEMEGFGR